MRINDTRSWHDRGVDAYFTPREAITSLMRIEKLPLRIVDPACGDGAILRPLQECGHIVEGYDIIDYGWPRTVIEDYTLSAIRNRNGIVTNPPYKLARVFLEKALKEAPFVAFLLRLNFLESISRIDLFKKSPPTRLWISSRRLPMMHRFGWTGPKTTSNQTFAWYVWNQQTDKRRSHQLNWFDWRDG